MTTDKKTDDKFSMWKGIPREEIEWHPIIDEEKCVGCGMCVTSCGRGVFGFDPEKRVSIVEFPNHCMVGCTSCEVWCVFDAISFPDKRYVKDIIRTRGVLNLASKELKERFNSDGEWPW